MVASLNSSLHIRRHFFSAKSFVSCSRFSLKYHLPWEPPSPPHLSSPHLLTPNLTFSTLNPHTLALAVWPPIWLTNFRRFNLTFPRDESFFLKSPTHQRAITSLNGGTWLRRGRHAGASVRFPPKPHLWLREKITIPCLLCSIINIFWSMYNYMHV